MKELIQLFTQIALLRRGPQDLPASLLLLTLTMIGYLVGEPRGECPDAAAARAWEEHPASISSSRLPGISCCCGSRGRRSAIYKRPRP